MENWNIHSSVIAIIASVGSFISMLSPEYEYREQLYNPANEPEKFSQWERFKEGFLKAGWKVRKVRRKKR